MEGGGEEEEWGGGGGGGEWGDKEEGEWEENQTQFPVQLRFWKILI